MIAGVESWVRRRDNRLSDWLYVSCKRIRTLDIPVTPLHKALYMAHQSAAAGLSLDGPHPLLDTVVSVAAGRQQQAPPPGGPGHAPGDRPADDFHGGRLQTLYGDDPVRPPVEPPCAASQHRTQCRYRLADHHRGRNPGRSGRQCQDCRARLPGRLPRSSGRCRRSRGRLSRFGQPGPRHHPAPRRLARHGVRCEWRCGRSGKAPSSRPVGRHKIAATRCSRRRYPGAGHSPVGGVTWDRAIKRR